MRFTIVAALLSFFVLLFAARLLLRFALLFFLAVAAFSFVSSERIMFVSVPSASFGTASISSAFLKRLMALAVMV